MTRRIASLCVLATLAAFGAVSAAPANAGIIMYKQDRALNPQPEVPSKPNAKLKKQQKSKPGPQH